MMIYNINIEEELETIKFIGHKCQEAKILVQKVLDKCMHFKFPSTWEETHKLMLGNENLIIKTVQDESSEYLQIDEMFRQGLPNKEIVKIERIQNKRLLKVFQTEIDYVAEKYSKKNGTEVEVKMLFHGTKSTNPNLIIDSEEGFDLRFG